MRRRRWARLPTDVLDLDDPRRPAAAVGDAMIRFTRRLHDAALPAGVLFVIAGLVLFSGSNGWAGSILLLVAPHVYFGLRAPLPRIGWLNDYRAPLLVLRSFTDERTKRGPDLPADDWDHVPRRNDHLFFIGRSLWDRCRVIILGGEVETGYPLFAIEVRVLDEEWEARLRTIASSAWAILVLPSNTDGCVRELELLADDPTLLDRTVVFMPPDEGSGSRASEGAGAEWERLRAELGHRGFRLPPYRRSGLLYRPDPTFGIRAAAELPGWRDWRRIERLVPGPAVLDRSLWDVLEEGRDAFESGRDDLPEGGVSMSMMMRHVEAQMRRQERARR